MNFAEPETAIKFDREIDISINNIYPMGIREQILEMREQKGLREGRTERDNIFVENLLRTTDFPDERIASLTAVSIDFVKEIREKMK